MYEKILVPLDGSELAEGALPYVEGLARKLGSEVILITVCTSGEYMERPLRAYLEKRAEELRSLGVKASPMVVQGDAANEILDFAQKNNIGLITISTHGRTGISRWALGSIANKVLQRSHIPILLIRSKELEAVLAEKELQKILILLDGSQFAESIIPYVEGLANGSNEVILLRIIEPLEIPHSLFSYDLVALDWDKHDKNLISSSENEVKSYLGKYERTLRDKGVKVSSAWLRGWPTHTILKYAEDNSVNLIAMSTHGSSGINGWAYGSVASKIIDGSSNPFLLIRTPLPALQQE